MPKKQKTGKNRKDKFYNLAKETGFRSRASFKLLQLNRKFNFLQNSRVCIDLCAAPGSWLQVAQQNMPQSSVIIGVDLDPIKPIPNVISFQDDITTEKCRSRLRKELRDWKADCVLHDGAPNVGKNWIHDAYGQSTLTLQAFKLACEMLRKGGWFVTKVFRSNDYNSLMWIFQQLFEKVHGTKPAASRNESAEIFVVCQGFKAPGKIDERFFDLKTVFEGVEGSLDKKDTFLKDFSEKKKNNREGYADEVGQGMHVKQTVTDFLACKNPLNFIAACNELTFDQDYYKEHECTNSEIIELCKDIKVLGPGDVKLLKKWHKKLQAVLEKEIKAAKLEGGLVEEEEEDEAAEAPEVTEEDADADMVEIDTALVSIKKKEVSELKRKKKLKMRALRKLKQAIADTASSSALGLSYGTDSDLFGLKASKVRVTSEGYTHDEEPELEWESEDEDAEKELRSDQDSEDEIEMPEAKKSKKKHEEDESKSLLVDFEKKEVKTKRMMNMWFTKDIFDGMDEDITNPELEAAAKRYKVGQTEEEKTKLENDAKVAKLADKLEFEERFPEDEESSDPDDYDSDEEADSEDEEKARLAGLSVRGPGWEFVDSRNKEPVEVTQDNGGFTPQELAAATEMAMSRKRKRELIECSYNRWTRDDDAGALPDWFVDDEKVHQRPDNGPSVEGSKNKELVAFYTERAKGANVRSIKKVAEAKARKKKKLVGRRDRARKAADGVEATEMSEREKSAMVKSIYRKAGMSMSGGLKEKQEKPTYVYGKGAGRRVSRPDGVKGKFIMADARMKNDLRHKKNREKSAAGKKKRVRGSGGFK